MRRSCPDTRLMASTAMVVGLLLCLAPVVAEASILLPDDSIGMQQILAEVDGSGASSSTSGTRHEPVPLDDQYQNPSDPLAQFLTPNSSTGSSSSGTSSSAGGAGGAGSFAIPSASALPISDADLVGRTLREQRFTLPTPPGNELLRPPRYVS